jgi:hypothetical protein
MSTISNIHTATVYNAKTSKALTGQRLVVTIAKKDKDGNYGPHLQQTMCTSVPLLERGEIDWTLKSVQEAATEYFTSVQNSIVSDKIKEGKKDITTQELDIEAIIDYLAQDAVGEKWGAERIAQWFSSNIATDLGIKLIELGCTDEVMETKLSVAEKRFTDTLATRARISGILQTELNKMLNFASDKNDAMYKRFYARVNPPAPQVVLEDSLGF